MPNKTAFFLSLSRERVHTHRSSKRRSKRKCNLKYHFP